MSSPPPPSPLPSAPWPDRPAATGFAPPCAGAPIALTCGDPAGIGAEIALAARERLGTGIGLFWIGDPRHLPAGRCGTAFDASFLDTLPAGVDPCGERGEFHTVVSYAPGFARRLELRRGETVTREGFVYTDFTLAHS